MEKKQKKIQWHPAFCSALRIEFAENRDDLEFQDEFPLTEKPLQIDCTVVKAVKNCNIKNEIGKIFETHNIFEYKSPKDGLNIDTFYKAIGYACLYKSLPSHVNSIPAEEITITLIRDRYPRKLFSEIKKAGFDYFKHGKGIYYVERLSLFKMQIIVSSELDEDAHLQLRALTDHMTDELFQKYLITMNKYPEWEKQLSDIVLQVIADSNMERIEEWKERDPSMCEAMKILMKDELDNQEKKGIETGKLQEIFSSVEEGDYSVERGAQKTGMLLSDFKNAMVRAGYKIPIEC